MNIEDLYAKKVPLKIKGIEVSGAYLQELDVTQLPNLQNALKKDSDSQINALSEIIKDSIVNDNDEKIFKDKSLSAIHLMDIANQVIEINTPDEGKSLDTELE